MGGRLGRKPGCIALAVAAFMLASMLGIAFERDLVGPLSQHGWGHSLQWRRGRADPAGGAGGFVIDKRIDTVPCRPAASRVTQGF